MTVASAATALHSVVVVRDLATDFTAAGIPMLVLKGPLLQQRLYGTFAAYPSLDADVLVRSADAPRVRRLLTEAGWSSYAMFLWRLSRTAVFYRDDVELDLHWGLHAGMLPSFYLEGLERALWEDATLEWHGLFEPAIEPLLVYLAMHAASHRFRRPVWVDTIAKAAERVDDWGRVWSLASACRMEGLVHHALAIAEGAPVTKGPLLDGWRRWLDPLFWVLRGHFLPVQARGAVRDTFQRLPSGHEASEESP